MGVKDTGDYLTARGANPRTGLISPSVGGQTPRTPMTPGEALELHSHAYAQHSPTRGPRPGPPSRLANQTHGQSPANQWKQCEKGWFMETVVEVPSPKNMTANTSAAREAHVSPEDRFIIPMPSAKEPRPYQDKPHTAEQIAALEHYKEKSSRNVSPSISPSNLNGRMFSIGAGPRKFAEASRKLRTHALDRKSPDIHPIAQQERQKHSPSPAPSAKSSTAAQAVRVSSTGSMDSVVAAVTGMPGGFDENASGNAERVTRKQVGSPPQKYERRGSDVTVVTTTWANEKEVLLDHGPPVTKPQSPSRPDPSANRFQDLRQLPRVRMVHPDHAANPNPQVSKRGPTELLVPGMKRVFTLPDAAATAMPLPYPLHSTMPNETSHTHTQTAAVAKTELSLVEKQFMTALAYIIRLPKQVFQGSWISASQAHHRGVVHAFNTLANEKADPLERFNSAKMLLVTAGKAMMLLGVIFVVVKISLAVWHVFFIFLWPVRVLLAVLRWMLGPSA